MRCEVAMVFTRSAWRSMPTLAVAVLMVSMGSEVQGQDQEAEAPAALCRKTKCSLIVDWRSDMPTHIDRRYGNPFQFESLLRGHLEAAGSSFIVGVTADDEVVTIRVEPEMMRALCNRVPGTDTDRSCETIGEVNVKILNVGPERDLKRSLRIRSRCGGNELMEIPRMAEYVAATIDYELDKRDGRRRPSRRC